jgi:hypothetical protein
VQLFERRRHYGRRLLDSNAECFRLCRNTRAPCHAYRRRLVTIDGPAMPSRKSRDRANAGRNCGRIGPRFDSRDSRLAWDRSCGGAGHGIAGALTLLGVTRPTALTAVVKVAMIVTARMITFIVMSLTDSIARFATVAVIIDPRRAVGPTRLTPARPTPRDLLRLTLTPAHLPPRWTAHTIAPADA